MDRINAQKRSENMSKIKSRDTLLELKVRRHLFSLGYRYRIHYPLQGKPDIVFPLKKIAIFVNGCFWHLHGCKNSSIPKSNTEFWKSKLESNKTRDNENVQSLKKHGWKILTLWECKLESNYMEELKKTINLIESIE